MGGVRWWVEINGRKTITTTTETEKNCMTSGETTTTTRKLEEIN